jgi:hypothetical protein
MVDDANDAGVRRHFIGEKRKARFLSTDEEHRLAHPGTHCVHGDERPPDRSPADTSTASTIPTIAASTGQSFNPAAIRAELPLTISTVSPTPASTVSTATR